MHKKVHQAQGNQASQVCRKKWNKPERKSLLATRKPTPVSPGLALQGQAQSEVPRASGCYRKASGGPAGHHRPEETAELPTRTKARARQTRGGTGKGRTGWQQDFLTFPTSQGTWTLAVLVMHTWEVGEPAHETAHLEASTTFKIHVLSHVWPLSGPLTLGAPYPRVNIGSFMAQGSSELNVVFRDTRGIVLPAEVTEPALHSAPLLGLCGQAVSVAYVYEYVCECVCTHVGGRKAWKRISTY